MTPMRCFHASLCWTDLPHLAEQARQMVEAGADALHLDVVETPHLPTLTRAPALVQALRHQTQRAAGAGSARDTGIEVHLTGLPDPALTQACVAAGADAIVFHAESTHHAVPMWRLVRRDRCRAGLALHPASSLDTLCGALGSIDQVLMVLTAPSKPLRPGWLERALPRIETVRHLIDSAGGGVRLQVEGGIDAGNVAQLARAGVDDFVLRHTFDTAADAQRALAALRAAQHEGSPRPLGPLYIAYRPAG